MAVDKKLIEFRRMSSIAGIKSKSETSIDDSDKLFSDELGNIL